MSPLSIELQSMKLPTDGRAAAALLNRGCVCVSVDREALRRALGEVPATNAAADRTALSSTHLFSDTAVFVAEAHLRSMAGLIESIERVIRLPGWRERVFSWAPSIARYTPKAAGVFLGYDFHLGEHGPQLIEINTNAGGALLNAKLLHAQRACCASATPPFPEQTQVEADFIAMFHEEWRLARTDAPLRCIAIVDQAPEEQFLAPEFELFRRLFESHGIRALVLDPAELEFDGKALSARGQTIDLVYNRLTDFSLDEPSNALLRTAYLADAVVLTPHPQAHALYADKRNLMALGDSDWLAKIGVTPEDRARLKAGVPDTVEVLPDNADKFWVSRKAWFFKPAAGYGSKATYRGDKLTRRVFSEIARGGYVAQALVTPSERRLLIDGEEKSLKLDLRNYAYRDQVQLISARLYQGQTTNFRTPGGGFAAVFAVACRSASESGSGPEMA